MQTLRPFSGVCAARAAMKGGLRGDVFTLAGLRRVALIETVAFLTCVVLLDKIFGDGTRFIGVALHPFWIIVLLVTLQYGIREALVAAALAGLFLLVGNLPEQSLTETMYEYLLRVMFLPFIWLVTALTLGAVRARQLQEREALLAQVKKSEAAVRTISDGYQTMKHAKEQLELRLAEEHCSVLTVYNAAKALEAAETGDLQSAVAQLVRLALKPQKFSIYHLKGQALELDVAFGWANANEYHVRFDAAAALTQQIIGRKAQLSIAQESDEAILVGQAMLAGPIINEKSGKIYGMLKIEEIGFLDLNIHTQEIFRILCEWIGRVYARRELPTSQESDALHVPEGFLQRIMYGRANQRIVA